MQKPVWDIINVDSFRKSTIDELQYKPDIGMVELFVSDNCPLKCRHCFHANVRSVDSPLSLEEWSSAIDQFIGLGVRHFHLAGREPFTEKITLDILAYLSARKRMVNLKLGAISNGLNCRKYLPVIQESALDYLEISIDGLEDAHDFMRGKGTYRRTVENLQEIVAVLGTERVSTATALSKKNIHQIPEIIQHLSHQGVRRFFFQPVVPMGYALSIRDLLISGEEYRQAILWTRQQLASPEFQQAGIVSMFYIPPEMLSAVCQGNEWIEQELLKSFSQEISVTRQGVNYLQLDFAIAQIPFWQHLIMTEDGYLISDCASRSIADYASLSVGSIRSQPLSELLEKTRLVSMRYLERFLKSDQNIRVPEGQQINV